MVYPLRLTFLWDDGKDTMLAEITVPEGTTEDDVSSALENGHRFLCHEDETDRYGIDGRNPETLLDYTCEKHGWSWARKEEKELFFD